jgi:hypothetical protein
VSDGLSDARQQAAIVRKVEQGCALIESALEEGGFDPVFGVNDAVIRYFNATFHKYGLEVRNKAR